MPLDNQGCTFTFKKLTRVPLRRRRRRSNHQKEEEETFARAMLQKKQKETTTVNRNVVVPACRGTRNRTYRSREDALKAWSKQTNTSFSFSKRERFVNAICVARVSEMKKKAAQKSRRSSPKTRTTSNVCPHLRRCDDGAQEENVTVLFPFDSAGFPSAGSVGKEREMFRRQQQGQRTIYKWQGWREAPRREREFVLKILARDTLIF